MRYLVTIGPFAAFFTNVNTEMKLAGHSHFAQVTLHFQHQGRGFPAFENTYRAVQDHIKDTTSAPFRNMTNEQVALGLYLAFREWTAPEIEAWAGDALNLVRLDLDVRGVPDKIGHADAFTRYTVEGP